MKNSLRESIFADRGVIGGRSGSMSVSERRGFRFLRCLVLLCSVVAAFDASAFTNLTLTKQASTPAVVPNGTFSYSLIAKNIGNDAAAGTVSIHDTLPTGITFEAFEIGDNDPIFGWSCSYMQMTRTAVCDRSGLSGTAHAVTIRVRAPALASGAPPLSIVNTANVSCNSCTESSTSDNTASATVRVEFSDLSLQKFASADSVLTGAPFMYSMYVTNASEAPDSSLTYVNDDLPPGIVGVHAWGQGWTCSLSGPANRNLSCRRDTAIPGATPSTSGVAEPINVSVFAPSSAGTIVNYAELDGTADATPDNNTADATVDVLGAGSPLPDLALLNEIVGSSPFSPGVAYQYSLTVSNPSSVAEVGTVTLSAVIPYPELVFVNALGIGWNCSSEAFAPGMPDTLVKCTREGVAADATLPPVGITVMTFEPGTVKVRGWVTGTADLNPADNIADSNATIVASNAPDLAISDVSNPGFPLPVDREGHFTYTLTIGNNGPGLPTGTTTVIDVLPRGVSLDSWTSTAWSCSQNSGTVTCTCPGGFVAGSSITLSVSAPNRPGTLINRAYVVNSVGDRNTSNNAANAATAVANSAPVASGDSYQVMEGQLLTVAAGGVLLNDHDVDNDPLTAIRDQLPQHGTVTLAPDGGFTYMPEAGFFGTDTFSYHASDSALDSNVANVTITVLDGNVAPVADAQVLFTPRAVPKAVTLTADDTDGDALSFSIVDAPDHGGQLTGTPPDLTYVPPAGFEGVEAFTFKANDGTLDSNLATVTITVGNGGAGNQAPVAEPQFLATAMGTSKAITLQAIDPEGAALTFAVVGAPNHGGQLTGTAPDLMYAPASGFNGTETFTFTANDGALDSNVATITITVGDGGAGNQPPVAHSATISAERDVMQPIMLTATDPESAPLTFEIVSPPNLGGQLQGTPPDLDYVPAAGFTGSETFTFRVNDGVNDSNTATVTIDVAGGNPPNEAPIADPQFVATAEGTPKAIVLTASDADGDPLSFSIVDVPAIGDVDGTPPYVTYSPPDGFNGIATFTFKASDGSLDSQAATITIEVGDGGPGNQAPVANPQAAYVPRNTPVPITLTASDPDGDALTFSIVDAPVQGGQLSGTPPDLVFAPAANFDGVATFTFKANDGALDSQPATVTLTIGDGGPGNQAPVAESQQLASAADTPLPIRLAAIDPDGDGLDFEIVATPNLGGSLTGSPPDVTYLPAAGFNGIETFTFKANDGELDSNVASVTIAVGDGGPGNQAPIADPQQLSTPQGQSLPITLTATDPDGDPLTFALAGPLTGPGQLTGTPPNLTYQPAAGFDGVAMFTFRASDAELDSNTAVVTIHVGAAIPPSVTCFLPDRIYEAGDSVILDLAQLFSPPSGQALAFGAQGLPASLHVDAVSGHLTGLLADSDVAGSPFLVSLIATTIPGGATASDSVRFQVLANGEILHRNGFDGPAPPLCP